ncbi:MAG: hypothetical protein ACI8VR_000955 [Candidatus Azotimanducaceae bacterium]
MEMASAVITQRLPPHLTHVSAQPRRGKLQACLLVIFAPAAHHISVNSK